MDVPHFLESMQRWWWLYVCVSGMKFVVFRLSFFISNDRKKLMLILWIRHISILMNVLGMPSNTLSKANKQKKGFLENFYPHNPHKWLSKIKAKQFRFIDLNAVIFQFCVDSFVQHHFQSGIGYAGKTCGIVMLVVLLLLAFFFVRNTTSKTSLFKRIKSLLYILNGWKMSNEPNSMDDRKVRYFCELAWIPWMKRKFTSPCLSSGYTQSITKMKTTRRSASF